jgi:hypothetical protein
MRRGDTDCNLILEVLPVGEAKRRKQLDPRFGKSKYDPDASAWVSYFDAIYIAVGKLEHCLEHIVPILPPGLDILVPPEHLKKFEAAYVLTEDAQESVQQRNYLRDECLKTGKAGFDLDSHRREVEIYYDPAKAEQLKRVYEFDVDEEGNFCIAP